MKKIEAFWSCSAEELFELLGSGSQGLATAIALKRNAEDPKRKRTPAYLSSFLLLLRQFRNPLVLLLVFAVILSFGTGTYFDGSIIFGILLLSGLLGFIQERRASKAAEALRALIQTRVRVKRDNQLCDIDLSEVTYGDVILLEAGDIVPADALILECRDLYMNESALTGESFPSEKREGILPKDTPLNARRNTVFRGTSVISGTAIALAVATGSESEFGKIEKELENIHEETAFETGIKHFGFLLMRIALIMSGAILVVNVVMGRPALDSVLFALALSIGITPELLPAIVTVTLSAGSKRLAAKKVIVKKLSSIQNLGSIDVLCSDKTGTLTEGEVKVHSCNSADGSLSPLTGKYAYLNSFFESGYSNPMDVAIVTQLRQDISGYSKVDEVPYDFIRKRLSIVVLNDTRHIMITKGSLKSVLEVCSQAHLDETRIVDLAGCRPEIDKLFGQYSMNGYRVIGVCYKDVSAAPLITKENETGMIFLGFILLNDPPREGIKEVIDTLRIKNISLKIITGDNALIARTIAAQLGIPAEQVVSGQDLHHLDDASLAIRTEEISIFAETEPSQKEQIVRALQLRGHVVGYLGDGINDASALKAADVGISVNNAVDVAKESADVILLEKNLDVISDGITEGRMTYINTMKYVLISICSNFGNMFSLAVLSVLFPYLPLLPAQILLINFLTDLPALAIVSDNVDPEFLDRPRKWNVKLIRNFMIVFGLESSLFDFITFFVLAVVFHLQTEATRTGWFVESVVTEVLILLVIRTHRTLLTSAPGKALQAASVIVIAAVLFLPYTAFAEELGLSALPLPVLFSMCVIAILYALLGEVTKRRIFKKMNY